MKGVRFNHVTSSGCILLLFLVGYIYENFVMISHEILNLIKKFLRIGEK